MIQRIQTLYILIALGLMIAFFFIPFAYAPTMDAETSQYVDQPIKALNFIGLIIPTAICLACLLGGFLSYSALSAQKVFLALSFLLTGACIGIVIYVITAGMSDLNPDVTVKTVWGGGGLLLIAAWIAEIGAFTSISSDQRKLSRADRLR